MIRPHRRYYQGDLREDVKRYCTSPSQQKLGEIGRHIGFPMAQDIIQKLHDGNSRFEKTAVVKTLDKLQHELGHKEAQRVLQVF